MRDLILNVLLNNTEVEGRYIGGGPEPNIIVFKDSEDQDKEDILRSDAGTQRVF